jgi:hypothetical protein
LGFASPPKLFRNWILAGTAGIAALKEAISLLPDGDAKEEAERAAREAERELKEAEADFATKLRFDLCLRCWPPEIMRINNHDLFVCRGCGLPDPQSQGGGIRVR